MSFQKFLDHYSRVTRISLKYNPLHHDSDCYLFLKQFTEDDLTKVAKHIRTRYEDNEGIMLSMLKFSFLVRQLDTFGELLAEAKAMGARKVSERDKVLQSTGRPGEANDAKEKPPERAREVLRRLSKEEMAQGFAAMKAALDAEPEEPPAEGSNVMPYQPILVPEPQPEQQHEPCEANNYGIEIEDQSNQEPPPPEAA